LSVLWVELKSKQTVIDIKRVPYLFSILCFALIALVAFQFNWLNKSYDLIQEQFDQKVNLAIGSTLSEFNSSHKTSLKLSEGNECSDDETLKCLPGQFSMKDQLELENNLKANMSCYGISEKYEVAITDAKCNTGKSVYCCSIDPSKTSSNDLVLGVSFETREKYLKDQMSPMIFSSFLIFLLLATVSFLILWALIKQKRITENNIDFFNNTAHELKTPLTNISLALKLLGKKYDGIESDRYAQIIKIENSKLTDQIERVLFLSKMENGDYKMKEEEIDLKEIVEEVVENMSLLINESNGSIDIQTTNPCINIKGDYLHISNVFRNLIDNALKYCENSPKIQISLLEENDLVKVLITDNGIGISAQDKAHIFKKFQRVNTGDIKRVKGFGIGLAYVKKVIELHKGVVSVESEINKGSEFKLLIPQL